MIAPAPISGEGRIFELKYDGIARGVGRSSGRGRTSRRSVA